jgi:hypothetical protein
MVEQNYNELIAAMSVIGNETIDGANTAQRIAGMLQGIIESSVLCARVSVSSAEILALHTTPKIIIPSPGVNKMISVQGCLVVNKTGATAYTGGAAGLKIHNTVTDVAGIDSQLHSVQESLSGHIPISLPIEFADANYPLRLVSGSAYASGDRDAEIYVFYKIIEIF